MHYTDIAEEILTQQFRENFGATPAISVNTNIISSINKEGEKSPFIRVGRGEYMLRATTTSKKETIEEEKRIVSEEETSRIINAFGMFWKRNSVQWVGEPKVLGRQQINSESVDFCDQRGVYLLHDGSKVVYVGRTSDRSLGRRLYEHTLDRLSGRWDRFSWFGLKEVTPNGKLEEIDINPSPDHWITTMEALLIEGLEPPQNRRRGDDFSAVEYLQADDPEIEEKRDREVVNKLLDSRRSKG